MSGKIVFKEEDFEIYQDDDRFYLVRDGGYVATFGGFWAAVNYKETEFNDSEISLQ